VFSGFPVIEGGRVLLPLLPLVSLLFRFCWSFPRLFSPCKRFSCDGFTVTAGGRCDVPPLATATQPTQPLPQHLEYDRVEEVAHGGGGENATHHDKWPSDRDDGNEYRCTYGTRTSSEKCCRHHPALLPAHRVKLGEVVELLERRRDLFCAVQVQ
jgi:hypothetical protein